MYRKREEPNAISFVLFLYEYYTVKRNKAGINLSLPYSHQGEFEASVEKMNLGLGYSNFSGNCRKSAEIPLFLRKQSIAELLSRNNELERRAFTGFGIYPETASHQFHQFNGDGQSNPRTAVF